MADRDRKAITRVMCDDDDPTMGHAQDRSRQNDLPSDAESWGSLGSDGSDDDRVGNSEDESCRDCSGASAEDGDSNGCVQEGSWRDSEDGTDEDASARVQSSTEILTSAREKRTSMNGTCDDSAADKAVRGDGGDAAERIGLLLQLHELQTNYVLPDRWRLAAFEAAAAAACGGGRVCARMAVDVNLGLGENSVADGADASVDAVSEQIGTTRAALHQMLKQAGYSIRVAEVSSDMSALQAEASCAFVGLCSGLFEDGAHASAPTAEDTGMPVPRMLPSCVIVVGGPMELRSSLDLALRFRRIPTAPHGVEEGRGVGCDGPFGLRCVLAAEGRHLPAEYVRRLSDHAQVELVELLPLLQALSPSMDLQACAARRNQLRLHVEAVAAAQRRLRTAERKEQRLDGQREVLRRKKRWRTEAELRRKTHGTAGEPRFAAAPNRPNSHAFAIGERVEAPLYGSSSSCDFEGSWYEGSVTRLEPDRACIEWGIAAPSRTSPPAQQQNAATAEQNPTSGQMCSWVDVAAMRPLPKPLSGQGRAAFERALAIGQVLEARLEGGWWEVELLGASQGSLAEQSQSRPSSPCAIDETEPCRSLRSSRDRIRQSSKVGSHSAGRTAPSFGNHDSVTTATLLDLDASDKEMATGGEESTRYTVRLLTADAEDQGIYEVVSSQLRPASGSQDTQVNGEHSSKQDRFPAAEPHDRTSSYFAVSMKAAKAKRRSNEVTVDALLYPSRLADLRTGPTGAETGKSNLTDANSGKENLFGDELGDVGTTSAKSREKALTCADAGKESVVLTAFDGEGSTEILPR